MNLQPHKRLRVSASILTALLSVSISAQGAQQYSLPKKSSKAKITCGVIVAGLLAVGTISVVKDYNRPPSAKDFEDFDRAINSGSLLDPDLQRRLSLSEDDHSFLNQLARTDQTIATASENAHATLPTSIRTERIARQRSSEFLSELNRQVTQKELSAYSVDRYLAVSASLIRKLQQDWNVVVTEDGQHELIDPGLILRPHELLFTRNKLSEPQEKQALSNLTDSLDFLGYSEDDTRALNFSPATRLEAIRILSKVLPKLRNANREYVAKRIDELLEKYQPGFRYWGNDQTRENLIGLKSLIANQRSN